MRDDMIDTVEINVLVAGLLRRRQASMTSMIALLDLMVLVSGNFPAQEKYMIANLLRDKADLVERPN
jgi:hypothetical protein